VKKILYIVGFIVLIFIIKTAFLWPLSLDKKEAHILFVGDMMFDRTIRAKAVERGYDYLFSCLGGYTKTFDTVVANLEGSITEYESLSLTTKPGDLNNTSFTFDPPVASLLFKNNIRMVNAGNNHSLDFGREGAASTRLFLDRAGVAYFGSPHSNLAASTTVNGLRISFVNFNQFLGLSNPQKTIEAIVEARKNSDTVFVYTHWGDEYVSANDYQKTLAHQFIDAGADMVIGSHPHVIQEKELYKGKYIFYSLGNFIFDQYWEDSVKKGGGVEVFITPRGIEVKEKSFELKRDGTTCLV
jgi:poly-gamma-glutamate capsule biosynthesis protein CapA/YwtB (metallophosphatase superfamily)